MKWSPYIVETAALTTDSILGYVVDKCSQITKTCLATNVSFIAIYTLTTW